MWKGRRSGGDVFGVEDVVDVAFIIGLCLGIRVVLPHAISDKLQILSAGCDYVTGAEVGTRARISPVVSYCSQPLYPPPG